MLMFDIYLLILIIITLGHYLVATHKSERIMDLIGQIYDGRNRRFNQITPKWSFDDSFDRGRRSLSQATGEDERRSQTDH